MAAEAAAAASTGPAHYAVDAGAEIPLKTTPDGIASAEPITIMDRFKNIVQEFGSREALAVKRDDVWHTWSYNDYYEDVKMAAKAFIRLGLEPGYAVGILGFNSPEWLISDLGAIFAGGLANGIYATNGPETVHYVANHSRSQVLVVENDKQLEKVLAIKKDLPHLKAIVQYTGTVDAKLKEGEHPVYEWDEFMRHGHDVPDFEFHHRMKAQKPGNCCTLIYTSGTTGTPKAVMISHDNVTWTTTALLASARVKTTPQEHFISYLPLSHIAAQVLDIHGPLTVAGKTWFARPDALKGTLPLTLKEVRPTIFLGVPRVWEKIEEAMKKKGAEASNTKRKIAAWAKRKGTAGSYAKQGLGKKPSNFFLANALVFKKVRKALGLDRCRFLATAAAPIRMETLEFFLALNLPIYEVYGMSENSGPGSISVDGCHRTGTCGKPMLGTEMKLDNPDADGNGEICMRGRHVFMGYLFNEEKTRESIDPEGWLHSGDIGKFDEDGFLKITGRIKELLITAGGENVPPVPIEDRIKDEVDFISNAMVIGDKRKFLSAIVSLKCVVSPDTGAPTDNLAPEAIAALKEIGCDATLVSVAMKDQKVHDAITEGLKRVNAKSVSNAQKVQKFKILPEDFSVPGGELGPTLKLRRPIVYKKYDELIESMY